LDIRGHFKLLITRTGMDQPSPMGTGDRGSLGLLRSVGTRLAITARSPSGSSVETPPTKANGKCSGRRDRRPHGARGGRHLRSGGSPRRCPSPRALLLGRRRGVPFEDDEGIARYRMIDVPADTAAVVGHWPVAEDVGDGFLFQGLRRTVADEGPPKDTDRGREG